MNKYQMTKEGLLNAQKELERLQARRDEIIENIKVAKEQGDLKENAEYHEAKNDMALNEGRLLELEDLIRNAEVVTQVRTDYIGVGSVIQVKGASGTKEYQIVGASEANPLQGKISDQSPLGSAFVNRKAGEKVEVSTPGGMQKYTIVKIIH